MSETRLVRHDGINLGAMDLRRSKRLIERFGNADGFEFWYERKREWLPIAGLIHDFDDAPEPRITQMASAGIAYVKILGVEGEDCPVCAALTKRTFPIDKAPAIPPKGCKCVPWCRLVVIPTSGPTAQS